MNKALIVGGIAIVIVGTASLGCGGKSTQTTVPTISKAQVGDFAALPPRSFLKASLPLVFDHELGEVADCLAPSESLEPAAPSEAQMATLEKNKTEFEAAVKDWLTGKLSEAGVAAGVIGAWTVEPTEYQVLSVHPAHIGFVAEPGCLDADKRQLDPTLSIVNALYGAQKFMVTAPAEFDLGVQQKMLESFEEQAVLVETAAYHYFQPALDESGAAKKNFDGENLYTSKTGELIPESQVPPNGERPMKEWTIAFDEPFFFGGGEYVPEWKNEAEEGKCDVYLIWDDPSPQMGECEEFNESGFSVTHVAETDEISLTVTTDGEQVVAPVKYDETTTVRANNRVVVWVTPRQIEEGVFLLVDSYVLRPVIEAPEPAPDVAKKADKKSKKNKKKNRKRNKNRSKKNVAKKKK